MLEHLPHLTVDPQADRILNLSPAPGPSNARHRVEQELEAQLATWSAMELQAFYAALRRFGRRWPWPIATAVRSKSVVQVQLLLIALHNAALLTPSAEQEIEEAIEVPHRWLASVVSNEQRRLAVHTTTNELIIVSSDVFDLVVLHTLISRRFKKKLLSDSNAEQLVKLMQTLLEQFVRDVLHKAVLLVMERKQSTETLQVSEDDMRQAAVWYGVEVMDDVSDETLASISDS